MKNEVLYYDSNPEKDILIVSFMPTVPFSLESSAWLVKSGSITQPSSWMLNNVVVWMLFPWHLTINQNIRFICPADVGYSHLREFMQKLLQTPLQLQVHSTQQWISSKNINHDFPRGTKLSSVMHRNFGGKSSPNSICLDTIISCFRPHQITQ